MDMGQRLADFAAAQRISDLTSDGARMI